MRLLNGRVPLFVPKPDHSYESGTGGGTRVQFTATGSSTDQGVTYPKCSTCRHWTPPAEVDPQDDSPGRLAGGFCQSKMFREFDDVRDRLDPAMLVTDHYPGGFWTGPLFGCVNHERVV